MESVKNLLRRNELKFTLWTIEAIEKELIDLNREDDPFVSDFEKLVGTAIIVFGIISLFPPVLCGTLFLDLINILQNK